MGGEGTFAGTTYQARVIAYIYAHMLSQSPLGWVHDGNDVPSAVLGETKGPGDDARVERASGGMSFEVQAKRRLTAGEKLDEVVDALGGDLSAEPQKVVLAIDRASTKALYTELSADLARLRTGRTDVLHELAKAQLERCGGDLALLGRLHVVTADLETEHDADYKAALRLILDCLENPEQARAAWWILVADAAEICGRQLRRTRQDLVALLGVSGIAVRPPKKDDRWHRQLDFTKQLLKTRHADAVLAFLKRLERDIESTDVEPLVRYRLDQQKAAAHLYRGEFEDTLRWAERALDVDPNGVHALVLASGAATYLGDLPRAMAFADRALEAHPTNVFAWGAKAKVAAAAESAPLAPPASIEESATYQTVLLEIADQQLDWPGALDISRRRLEAGDRDPPVLIMRARSLVASAEGLPPDEQKTRAEEAIRLITELLDQLGDPEHPIAQSGLLLRVGAWRMLGRQREADEDLLSLERLAPESVELVGPRAQAHLEAGELDAALRILQHPGVEGEPFLLALRARVLADRKEVDAARSDIKQALESIANSMSADNVRIACAEAAVALADAHLAERLVESITPDGSTDGHLALIRGRIAGLRDDYATAEACYREAAGRMPARAHEVISELAVHAVMANHKVNAVRLFKELPSGKIPPAALRFFVRALVDLGELSVAAEIIDSLATNGQLDDWALGAATEIALRAEDVDSAITHLSVLVAKGAGGPTARAELARRLIEVGRLSDARPHIEGLLAASGLEPVQQMQVAQLLHAAGEHAKAIPIAFSAFRRGHDDPRFHKAYIGMILATPGEPPVTDEVAPDTFVRLTRDEGPPLEYTIFEDPPIDPLRREIGVAEAQRIGLLGKRLREVVPRQTGSRTPTEWKVVEILPAWLHAFHEAMLNFEDRFPGEPFFIKGFSVGDGSSLKAFAPILRSLEERKEHVEELFRTLREQVFPLGFVVRSLGTNVEDVMGYMSARPHEAGPVIAEWADASGQEESRITARLVEELVLTRTALTSCIWLDLLSTLAGARYRLVVPKSLLDELSDELKLAERTVSAGTTTITANNGGLSLCEEAPNSAAVLNRRDHLGILEIWVRENATVLTRPLESIGLPGSPGEHARDLVGHSSYDAVVLVKLRGNSALYADDLGLRRLLRSEGITRSVSTVSLVESLAELGVIDAGRRNDLLLNLVVRNYAVIRPSRTLLEAALASTTREASVTRRAFALLGNPELSLGDAAHIAAEAIKASVTMPVQLHSCEAVTRLAMGGLMTRWAPRAAAQALTQAARRELTLMPQHELAVLRTCARLLKGDQAASGADTMHIGD